MKRSLAAVLCIFAVVGFSACGSSGRSTAASTDSTSSSSTATQSPDKTAGSTAPSAANTPDALKTAVKQYSDAYFNGSGMGAYALLSQRCQAANDEGTFVANVTTVGQQYKGALPVMTSLSVNVNGDSGTATYSYDRGDFNQTNQPWTFERGGWKYNQC